MSSLYNIQHGGARYDDEEDESENDDGLGFEDEDDEDDEDGSEPEDSEEDEDDDDDVENGGGRKRKRKQKKPKIDRGQEIRVTSISDLPRENICSIPVEISLLASNNRTRAFRSPIDAKSSGVMVFKEARHLTLGALDPKLKDTFFPDYNKKLVEKKLQEAHKKLQKQGLLRQLNANINMLEKAQLGFLTSNKRYTMSKQSVPEQVKQQLIAAMNGAPIPKCAEKGLLSSPGDEHYLTLGKEPWFFSRLQIELLLPETRAFLTHMTQFKCKPVVAAIACWDEKCNVGCKLDFLWRQEGTEPAFVLCSLAIGSDHVYEMDAGADDRQAMLAPPFQTMSNCARNHDMIKMHFRKKCCEFTFDIIIDHCWIFQMNSYMAIQRFDLESWVEQKEKEAIVQLKAPAHSLHSNSNTNYNSLQMYVNGRN